MVILLTDFVHRLTSDTYKNVKKLLRTLFSKMVALSIKPVRLTGWFQERIAFDIISFLIFGINAMTTKLNI